MPAKKSTKNINLIIKDGDRESISGQLLSFVLTYGRYIIILIQIVVLSVFFLRFKLDRDHTDLKEAVSQKQALVQSVSDLETEIRHVQKKLADIRIASINQNLPIRILRFLQNTTPDDITFTSITINSSITRFVATAGTLKSFNYFLRLLQQEPGFFDMQLEDLARKPDGRIEFKITAQLNPKGFP